MNYLVDQEDKKPSKEALLPKLRLLQVSLGLQHQFDCFDVVLGVDDGLIFLIEPARGVEELVVDLVVLKQPSQVVVNCLARSVPLAQLSVADVRKHHVLEVVDLVETAEELFPLVGVVCLNVLISDVDAGRELLLGWPLVVLLTAHELRLEQLVWEAGQTVRVLLIFQSSGAFD